jgi:trans-aconitate 2-methyltransferase
MNDWNPEQYLQFKTERTQPSIDLVSRINLEPKSIIDIGCGPGNSTQVLVNRWPDAELGGLDKSAAMIEKARENYPRQQWIIGDGANIDANRKYDLVFSNATLQWIPGHEQLIPGLWNIINENGAFAVQIPMFKNMPIHTAIETVANDEPWEFLTRGCQKLFTYHEPSFYYELLYQMTERVEIWETAYFHILNSQEAVIDFVKSTGMKPFLDSLSTDEMRLGFEQEVLQECKKYYQIQSDGKVLFPFQRLFFIGYK